MKSVLIYRVKTECLEPVKTGEELLNPVTAETETPCSYSNRSLTLPQATGKMSMCAWEGLCTYVHAWVAGLCVCVSLCVSLTDGQETLTGLFARSVFWSLDQRAHHLTATAVWGTLARTQSHTHARTQAFTHARTHIPFCRHTCTFTHGHCVAHTQTHKHTHAHTHKHTHRQRQGLRRTNWDELKYQPNIPARRELYDYQNNTVKSPDSFLLYLWKNLSGV